MQRTIALISAVTLSLGVAQWCYAGDVDIEYALINLGGNHWQYTYNVTNNALSLGVEEFTIWFEPAAYAHLTLTTLDPPAGLWDEIVVQPDALFSLNGYYDTLTKSTGIDVGQSVQGFSVAFDWLGAGVPGPQAFDIVNPSDYQQPPLCSGTTFPEPAAVLLMGAGLALCCRRRH